MRLSAQLVAAMALLLVSVGPRSARAQLNPDFPRADAPPRLPAKKPPVETPDSPGDAPPDVPRLVLGAGPHVAFGIAPQVALGIHAAIELATMRWSLGLEGRHDLAASGQTGAGSRARTSLAALAFVPCARTQALWACAVFLAGDVSASGRGPDGSRETSGHAVIGIGARLAAHVRMPFDFALRFTAEGLVHPIPWDLSENGVVFHEASVVSTTVGVGLVHAF